METFQEKLKCFINLSQNNVSKDIIKKEYLKLVKEFHPDTNKSINNKLANEYMININYVYEHLINNKNIVLSIVDEYENNMENGKYFYINDYGRKEYVKEKALFVYKLALLEYNKCYGIMFNNSVFDGKRSESGYEVIKHLYKSHKILKDVYKLDQTGLYKNMADILLNNINKMNESITRGLNISNEKQIMEIEN